MGFPPPGAEINYNEAGEPIGWDMPDYSGEAYYCDDCGFSHTGECQYPEDDDEEEYENYDEENGEE